MNWRAILDSKAADIRGTAGIGTNACLLLNGQVPEAVKGIIMQKNSVLPVEDKLWVQFPSQSGNNSAVLGTWKDPKETIARVTNTMFETPGKTAQVHQQVRVESIQDSGIVIGNQRSNSIQGDHAELQKNATCLAHYQREIAEWEARKLKPKPGDTPQRAKVRLEELRLLAECYSNKIKAPVVTSAITVATTSTHEQSKADERAYSRYVEAGALVMGTLLKLCDTRLQSYLNNHAEFQTADQKYNYVRAIYIVRCIVEGTDTIGKATARSVELMTQLTNLAYTKGNDKHAFTAFCTEFMGLVRDYNAAVGETGLPEQYMVTLFNRNAGPLFNSLRMISEDNPRYKDETLLGITNRYIKAISVTVEELAPENKKRRREYTSSGNTEGTNISPARTAYKERSDLNSYDAAGKIHCRGLRDFGECTRGKDCTFSHDISKADGEMCWFTAKLGTCRYRNRCTKAASHEKALGMYNKQKEKSASTPSGRNNGRGLEPVDSN